MKKNIRKIVLWNLIVIKNYESLILKQVTRRKNRKAKNLISLNQSQDQNISNYYNNKIANRPKILIKTLKK